MRTPKKGNYIVDKYGVVFQVESIRLDEKEVHCKVIQESKKDPDRLLKDSIETINFANKAVVEHFGYKFYSSLEDLIEKEFITLI